MLRSTHNINITPIGSLYIYFLDSDVKKYVFHNSLIYNSRNIHSQINSWIYYVTISFPWFSNLKLNWTEPNGYFFWLSASVETRLPTLRRISFKNKVYGFLNPYFTKSQKALIQKNTININHSTNNRLQFDGWVTNMSREKNQN